LLSERAGNVLKIVVPRSARNWLRSPSKSIGWLWDSLCFLAGDTKELALVPGCVLVCHPRVYKTFLNSQLSDPEQSAEFRNFVKYCNPSMCLFDIGASFGAFSFVTAHFGGTAIAVDPSPIAARFIRLQSRLNGFEKRIQIVEACVSDAVGETEMLSSGVFSDGYFQIARGRSTRELTKTKAVTIDGLVEQFGRPTHIKIDVEGHEAAVIQGARKTLACVAPLLFLELHNEMVRSSGGNPERVLDDLAEMNYEVFSINGEKIHRSAILEKPICRLVGRRWQTV
jgi:FkbM family methyltransferase